jgi:hypothetical protein
LLSVHRVTPTVKGEACREMRSSALATTYCSTLDAHFLVDRI